MDVRARDALAGALAGLAGLVVFTLLHVLLVGPLWFLLAVGLLPALLGGAVVGLAFREVERALPQGLRGGAAYGGLLWLTLGPLEVVALERGPLPGVDPLQAMRVVPIEVLLAPLAGLLLGIAWARAPRPALALAIAALVLAIPVSGTLLALGASRIGPPIFVGMAVVDVVAGVVLAAARSQLAAGKLLAPSADAPP
jgi:hypothetical protein